MLHTDQITEGGGDPGTTTALYTAQRPSEQQMISAQILQAEI